MAVRLCTDLGGRTTAACLAATCLALLAGAAPGAAADPPGDESRLLAETARLERLAAVYGGFYVDHPDAPARLLRIGLPADDVSVALWLAAVAVADPHAIASARLKGRARWSELMRAYRVPPRALYVRLDGPAPADGPYARPYRVLTGRARGPLTDREVRDLVQLRLLTEYYRLRPSRVIGARAAGRSSVELILEADRRSGARPLGRPLGRRS